MKLHQSLIIIFIFVIGLTGDRSFAASEADDPTLVSVESPEDVMAPYKKRRDANGSIFSIYSEQFLPSSFSSSLDGLPYSNLFGSTPISLLGIEANYKRNLAFGSVALGLHFSKGTLSDSTSGQSRKIDINKYGISSRIILDTLFPEPYIAPYVGVNVWQMGILESSPIASNTFKIDTSMNVKFGIMFQLDWIDYEQAKKATFGIGLENTYIDVYATQYNGPSGANDPNLKTDTCYGAGLSLEF